MIVSACGIQSMQFPDVGDGVCCMGAAAMDRCTCWEPVYDKEQEAIAPGDPEVRLEMCGDCAFRPDSPERSGDDRYQHSEEGGLEEVVLGRGRFYCHDGMRRILEWVHPPTGTRIPATSAGAYEPPEKDGVAYKANGEPAGICAGFASRRLKAGGLP